MKRLHSALLIAAGLLMVAAALAACAPDTPAPTPLPPVPTTVPTAVPTAIPTPARVNTPPPLTGVAKPPAGKYLLLEMTYVTDGTGKLPQLMIDFPAYRFDPATGILSPFSPGDAKRLTLSDSDWGLFGRTSGRRNAAGGGASGSIGPIASLPYTFTVPVSIGVANADGMDQGRAAPAQLNAIAADGSVDVTIDGERAVLAPGASWTRTVEFDIAVKTFNGRYIITSNLRNDGWQDRAKIRTQVP